MPLTDRNRALVARLHRLQAGHADTAAAQRVLDLLPLVGLTPATLLGPVQLWPAFPQRFAAEQRVDAAVASGLALDVPTPRGVLRLLRRRLRTAVDRRLRFRLPGGTGDWAVLMPTRALEEHLGRAQLWDPDAELVDTGRRARRI